MAHESWHSIGFDTSRYFSLNFIVDRHIFLVHPAILKLLAVYFRSCLSQFSDWLQRSIDVIGRSSTLSTVVPTCLSYRRATCAVNSIIYESQSFHSPVMNIRHHFHSQSFFCYPSTYPFGNRAILDFYKIYV